jgi:hypothetical protein
MTTRFDINGIWQGDTVAILGAGPDMTSELAQKAKEHKTIAVNRAIKFASNADMFVALDPHHPFWDSAKDFKGIKICGVECDYDAYYIGMMYEKVEITPGHVVEIRNNALAAIRIAYLAGAKKIILLGFDPERYEEIHAHTGFYGLKQGLEQITSELISKGVEVDRIDSEIKKPGTRPPRRSEINTKTFPEVKTVKK